MAPSYPQPTISCIYKGRVPLDNEVCSCCIDFLETCTPIITTIDGYSASSECDRYMCEGCINQICTFKD